MKFPQSESSGSPSVHRANIQRELTKLIQHVEADTRRVDDERFRGLLEKSAEVLKSLHSLFERYQPSRGSGSARAGTPGRKGELAKSGSVNKAKGRPMGASRPKSGGEGVVADKRKGAPTKDGAEAKPTSQKVGAQGDSGPGDVTATPAPTTPKPQDPLITAAREQQQRREARAPKMPNGQSAPRPAPPRSGKPVWSKPHSS
jgi:hypothetical protein